MDRRILATLFAVALLALVPAAASAGPIVLMGIDAEDGGPNEHGPIANYVQIANNVKGNVSNGGSGILVIGGGKDPEDDVTQFWNAVGSGSSQSITYVNGASDIGSRSFSGFGTIAVVSSDGETPSGGLTQAENDALTNRRSDVAKFVNEGGGLIGFSQTGLSNASRYGYISEFGSFEFNTGLSYSDIDPTPDGEAIGVNNDFDICCWHDTYTKFPSFLKVLAFTDANSSQVSIAQNAQEAAALGGKTVFIDNKPPASTANVPSCSTDGRIRIAVSDESGGSGPKAARFKIDGGAERVESTDSGGVAVATVPNGRHSLEYWGEDKAGNQESPHHTVQVNVDTTNGCVAAAQAGISSNIARLSGGCVRGSSVLVRMRVTTPGALRYARVAVDGKRVRSTKKKVFSVRIKLRGMKVGRHRVVLTAQNTAGRSTVSSRSFARCAQVSPRFTG